MIDPAARHARAIELRIADRAVEALAEVEALLATGFAAAESRLLRAHLLGDLGRFDEAVIGYRAVLADAPTLIDAHETLAALLPQIGQREQVFDGYRAALAERPDFAPLWLSALGAAKAQRNASLLLSLCSDVESRFGPDVLVSVIRAQALSWQGLDAAALDIIGQAIAVAPSYQPLFTTQAHIALRLGDATLAKQAAFQAAQRAPEDQTAWALLSVALRLLDDPREHWLCDYERLIRETMLEDVDLAGVAETLTALHLTGQAPADQSLRGGTQTRGNLFDKQAPAIVALRQAIERSIARTLETWGSDPKHPFLRRKTGGVRFAGSWSVRLREEGFHVSHIHPSGWLSSACYIALPPGVVAGDGDRGALAFGIPDAELGLDLPARRVVWPVVGKLVLFPSYLWHRTIPFSENQPRLTAAFDALPA